MVRGLLIRRIFVLLDLALAALVVITIGLIVLNTLAPDLLQKPVPKADAGGLDELAIGESADGLPDLGARDKYQIIAKNGLFGEAGRWDPTEIEEPPPPEPVEEPVEETSLNLRLVGTSATSPRSAFASAIIENLDKRNEIRAYFTDDEIVEKVVLKEVYARSVIILNERVQPPKKERLSMDEEETEGNIQTAQNRPTPPQRAANTAPKTITVDKQEIMQEIYMNYADLVSKVKPRMYRDENGRVAGVTADNIEEIPLARKLGLSDGDVLQSVNNEQINSEQKIMELVQKYRNSNSIRIGVLRNGKPTTITYRLD